MKRLLALLLLLPSLVFAQSSPNWPLGYQPSVEEWNAEWASKLDYGGPPNASILYASDFGVVANTGVSMDVKLKAAIDGCAVVGGKLVLPPGQITLTGAATSTLQNCGYAGSSVPAGTLGVAASNGTMFVLTSTSVKPFQAGNNWSMSGIGFYWPNQTTGTTVYPALLNMDGDSCAWEFTGNTVINAYDFLVDTPGHCQAGWNIHDNQLYAVHDLIRSSGQGDAISVGNNQMTPGAWLRMLGSSTAVKTAIDAGALVNTIFHITSNVGFGWNLTALGNRAFDWRYGFRMDSGGIIGISNIDMTWDGVQTLIDTSAGGTWSGNKFSGAFAGCNGVSYVLGTSPGNAPCFNLGALGSVNIVNLQGGSANGTFLKTAGATVHLIASRVDSVGGINDGADYYGVDYAANPGGLVVEIKNNQLGGRNASTKVHGIGSSAAATASRLVIQNNEFLFWNDDITVASAPTTVITGNWSVSTQGTASFAITGSNPITYNNNQWDKPPVAVIASGFGTGASITGGIEPGTFQINVGTGGTASTGTVTMAVPSIHAFGCSAVDRSSVASFVTEAIPGSGTTTTITNFSRTTGLQIAWTASDLVVVSCAAY